MRVARHVAFYEKGKDVEGEGKRELEDEIVSLLSSWPPTSTSISQLSRKVSLLQCNLTISQMDPRR